MGKLARFKAVAAGFEATMRYKLRRKADKILALTRLRSTEEGREKIRLKRRQQYQRQKLRDPVAFRKKRREARKRYIVRNRDAFNASARARRANKRELVNQQRAINFKLYLKKHNLTSAQYWKLKAARVKECRNYCFETRHKLTICEGFTIQIEQLAAKMVHNLSYRNALYKHFGFTDREMFRRWLRVNQPGNTLAMRTRNNRRHYEKRRSTMVELLNLNAQLTKEANNDIKAIQEYRKRVECEQLERRVVEHLNQITK